MHLPYHRLREYLLPCPPAAIGSCWRSLGWDVSPPDTQKQLQEQRPKLSGPALSDMAKMDLSLTQSMSPRGILSILK